MLVFYLRHYRTLRAWTRRHPRLTALIIVGAAVLLIDAIGTGSALADDAAGAQSVPYLPPGDMQDTHGVSLAHYAVLPLDRGDQWTMQKTFWTSLVDTIWVAHLSSLAWMLWLFQFQLSFQWVDWIATPLTGIGQAIHNVVSAIGWPALALAITAVVAGTAIMLGKVAKGLIEIGISVLCAALAVGILVNPIGSITGPDGALTWVEANGGNLAVSIASDDPTTPTGTPQVEDASKVLSTTITAQLIDVFVRHPAQEIAFGHDLTGSCDDTFTTQMKSASPIDTSSTSVRDAVHGCDQEAWDYVTNPGPGMVITAFVVSTGGGALLLLALALGMVLLMCVLYALWSALKLVGLVYAAMLPGVAREALFKSLIGMWVAVLSVGLVVVVMSGYLRLLSSIMTGLSEAGLPVLSQTTIVDFLVVVLAIALFILRRNAKRAGDTLAARLARIGFGGKGSNDRRPNPVLQSAQRVGENYLASRMRRPAAVGGGGTTINILNAGAAAAAGAVDGGHIPATGPSRGSGGGTGGGVGSAISGALAARGMISSAATIGAAAATGGTSAVVMAAGKVAGKQILQRAVATGAQRALSGGSSAPAVDDRPATYQGFGRQIVVGGDGVGTVSPQEAPQRNGVYRVTTVGQPSVADERLRRTLAAAAQRKELSA